MKIYLVLTPALLRYAESHAVEGYTPMLNDHRGDTCHVNEADAVEAGLALAATDELAPRLVNGKEPARAIDIVTVTYGDALHDELRAQGEIMRSDKDDFFGKPLWSLTSSACARLNASASFDVSVHTLPVELTAPQPAPNAWLN